MNLLILGGTGFLGRYLVEAARGRGHEVTVFSRGRLKTPLGEDVEHVRGDRQGDLQSLRARRWDAAVDACGFIPRQVRDAAELLADAVEHYTFISSIAAYADFSAGAIDEIAPVKLLPQFIETVSADTYGPLKARCEQAAEAALPGRVLHVRPGILVGPHDNSDRFTYWVRRVAQGGEVLAPGEPQQPVQFIDVRDLADWLVRMIESSHVGTYNAVGPSEALTMSRLLELCREVSGSSATFNWVAEETLLRNGIPPFLGLPLWVSRRLTGFFSVDSRKAVEAGLRFRPVEATIADTLEWSVAARPPGVALAAGLSHWHEKELLLAATAPGVVPQVR